MPKAKFADYHGPTVLICIGALGINNLGDGRFEISIPIREITQEDMDFLKRLFPNVSDAAFRLLNKEALLSAME